MKARASFNKTASGSALLVVLWALILLTAAVFGFAKWVQQDIQAQGRASREMEARAMAHSGVVLGLHPLVSQQTPDLNQEFPGGMGFKVRIVGEGGKLNVRWLLEGEEPPKLAILKQWLEQRGLNFEQRETLVDCLLDWVDADDAHRLNGVEDDGDYHPPNRPLQSIEEIEQVRGSAPLVRSPGWKDELTIFTEGRIDITAADAAVLRLLPGLGEARLQRLLAFRRGKDGVDGTPDDNPFADLHDVQVFLGLSEAQFKELGALITPKDQTLRIIGEGHSADVYRQVEAVARKGGGNPQLLSWKE